MMNMRRDGRGGRPNINTVLWEHSETLSMIHNKYETVLYMDMQERFARLWPVSVNLIETYYVGKDKFVINMSLKY